MRLGEPIQPNLIRPAPQSHVSFSLGSDDVLDIINFVSHAVNYLENTVDATFFLENALIRTLIMS